MVCDMTYGNNDRVDDLVAALVLAKKKKAESEASCKAITSDLVRAMEAREEVTLVADVGSQRFRVTAITTERIVYDESKIRKSVGEKTWKRLTDRKISTTKLEDAVTQGLVDQSVLQKNAHLKKSAPFVRITGI